MKRFCIATRKSGEKCRYAALPDEDYCGIHLQHKNKQERNINEITCRHDLSKHPKLSRQVIELYSNTKNCKNKTTFSGFKVSQYIDLLKINIDNETYCFDPKQLDFLNDVNPFTGKKFKFENKSMDSMPPSSILTDGLCPLERLKSIGNVIFLVSRKPIKNIKRLDQVIHVFKKSHSGGEYSMNYRAYLEYTGPSINSNYVYMAILRHKINQSKKYLYRDDIVDVQLFHQKPIPDASYQINDNEVLRGLRQWFTYSVRDISDQVSNKLLKLNIKLDEPIRAFRGLLIDGEKILLDDILKNLEVGHDMTLASDRLSSWSADSCLSLFFATTPVVHRTRSPVNFGILVSAILQPDDILIDTRLMKDRAGIYPLEQSEIIVKKSKKIQCKVERLYMIKNNNTILPVSSFRHYLEFTNPLST